MPQSCVACRRWSAERASGTCEAGGGVPQPVSSAARTTAESAFTTPDYHASRSRGVSGLRTLRTAIVSTDRDTLPARSAQIPHICVGTESAHARRKEGGDMQFEWATQGGGAL